MSITFLKGERVMLRPLNPDDLTDDYVQWLNDEEVCRYNSHATFPYTREKMHAYYQSLQVNAQTAVVLAMVDIESDTHIGNISLQNISWLSRNAESAILLGNKDFWGKGLAAEAGRLICAYGFKRLNLHRIYCGTSAQNSGMQRLADALSMKREGIRRQAMFKNGVYEDIWEYGVLQSEFIK